MVCHRRGLFHRAAVLEISRDPGCSQTVVVKFDSVALDQLQLQLQLLPWHGLGTHRLLTNDRTLGADHL